MLWFKFGFSVTAPLSPFSDQARAVSFDLSFAKPLISESRAWFRKQQTPAKFEWARERVGFFVLLITHLKKVSRKCFPWLKWGNKVVKPFPPPPPSPSLTPPVCFRFCFLFPWYPTSQSTLTACYPPDHTKHTTSSVVTEMRSGVKRYSIAG